MANQQLIAAGYKFALAAARTEQAAVTSRPMPCLDVDNSEDTTMEDLTLTSQEDITDRLVTYAAAITKMKEMYHPTKNTSKHNTGPPYTRMPLPMLRYGCLQTFIDECHKTLKAFNISLELSFEFLLEFCHSLPQKGKEELYVKLDHLKYMPAKTNKGREEQWRECGKRNIFSRWASNEYLKGLEHDYQIVAESAHYEAIRAAKRELQEAWMLGEKKPSMTAVIPHEDPFKREPNFKQDPTTMHLKKTMDQQKEKIAKLEQERKRESRQKEKYHNRLQKLQAETITKDNTIRNLRGSNTELIEQIKGLSKQLEEKKAQLKRKDESLAHQQEDSEERLHNLIDEIKDLKLEKENLSKAIEKVKMEAEEERAKKEAIHQERQQEMMKHHREFKIAAEGDLQEKREKIKLLQAEKKDNQEKKEKEEQYEQEIQRLKAENHQINTEMEETRKVIDGWNRKVNSRMSEMKKTIHKIVEEAVDETKRHMTL